MSGQKPIRRANRDTTFIETGGGLLTEQLVRKLRGEAPSESAVKPKTFSVRDEEYRSHSDLESEMSEVWDDLKERWDSVSQNSEIFEMDTTQSRDKWIVPLLEALGFEPAHQNANLSASGVTANLSHLGWAPKTQLGGGSIGGTPPVTHLVRPDKDEPLDSGNHRGSRSSGQSPHDELQRYLNAADPLWSIVTDGLKIRLLRDYHHTYTRGYVEFDLENIFTNRNYEDFRALFRLCHVSRFVSTKAEQEEDDQSLPLERLYDVAISTGVKVGKGLQDNVVSALETLGNGFLDPELKNAIEKGGQDATEEYYQDLLYIVYRLLFLMFAEQRGIMVARDSLYMDEYSITKLRERAERRDLNDRNTDLWEGLKATFTLVGEGDANLNIPGYNGGLFDDNNLEYIKNSSCPNDKLLSAINDLTHVEQDGYRQRISYADLGVEEIGAVYESLLEFTPQIAETALELESRDEPIRPGAFYLDDRGIERKETGSYYTDPELVSELIDSALEPVVDDRVDEDASPEVKEEQLLSINVCDPAVGSGAFLIAANNYLGKRLAEIRSDSAYPSEETVREARRSVVQHCIYGVDLNQMAVELAKVSLWINSAVADKPLNFLDHRIKHGNSLLGTTPELISKGVPRDVFSTSGGRSWHNGNAIRARVKTENNGVQTGLDWDWKEQDEYVDLANELDLLEENEISDIERKEQLYRKLQESEALHREKLVHDVWTAAAYWPLDGTIDEYPTPKTIEKIRREPPELKDEPPEDLSGLEAVCVYATQTATRENFFHWPLEFPAVYSGNAGFDCLLGNPPWEKLNFEEEQFFAVRAPEIADAATADKREKMIETLEETNPELYEEYQEASEAADDLMNFMRNSGKYELSGQGHVNTYALFSEWFANNVRSNGRVGVVVPTGIATDHTTADFFRHIVENQRLVSLYDYNNNKNIFPGIDNRIHFCLFTLTGTDNPIEEFDVAFGMDEVEQLHDEGRRYTLSREDIEKVNPNTGTAPTFKTPGDADLVLDTYETTGVLVEEDVDDGNPWDIDISRMFNMSDDSDLFWTVDDFEPANYERDQNWWVDTDTGTKYIPLYESKLVHQYNHRFATFEDASADEIDDGDPEELETSDLDDPSHLAVPRYWIEEDEYVAQRDDDWHLVLRDITNSTNERTAVSSLIPRVATGHTLNHIYDASPESALLLMSSFNSFALDFVARQKVGGTHLSHYIIRQLPVPSPERFNNVKFSDAPIRERIIELALQLSYTASDLDPFTEQFGRDASSFQYTGDSRPREEIRFELEALMCHVFGLSSNDFERLFDSFTQIKRKDMNEYGYYRTRDEIKERFNELADAITDVSEEK